MVIVQTPLRISFFGGGTDYPVWFREHGGAVLATSIDKYIYTHLRLSNPYHEHRYRIIYSKVEDVNSLDQIQHPAVREGFRFMGATDGMELHHDSDIPARSGMGSSSSFMVGLLHSLHALGGQHVDKTTLAMEAIHVEQEMIKENVGCQDQVMAAFGGFNHVSFHTDGTFTAEPVAIKRPRLTELHQHLMLFYTGVQRLASDVAAEQIKNTPKKADELRAIQKMVPEGLKILTGEGSLLEFGKLLHEGWQMKRTLSSKITNNSIDDIYNAALAAGAAGGKLLGAGGGGFMLFLVPPEKQAAVKAKLKHLLHIKFHFESRGTNIIFSRDQAA
jgi:D-glycero-alpha-D-manno-heptose-7-phosphate kinase